MEEAAAKRWLVAAAFALIVFALPWQLRASSEAYQIDPERSRVTIAVGKAGAFSFLAGHTHEVSGPIESGTLDLDRDDLSRSHVRIVVSASSLKVSGEEPDGDRPKVQAAMESDKVLDVARYPRIAFESTSITTRPGDGNTLDVVVDGRLTIRGVTRPVTAPVHVTLADQSLTASGRFSVKQTAFGITPISVGGIVTVKDALDIAFSIVARR